MRIRIGCERGSRPAVGLGMLALSAALVAAAGPPDDPKAAPGPAPAPGAPPDSLVRAAYTGRPAPGLRVTLRAEPLIDGPVAYRWVQVGGPAVALDDPAAAEPRFIVPDSPGLLEFALFAGDGRRAEAARLVVPIEGPDPTSTGLKADAGDDQLALVGRRVTLNALRSEPHGAIGFRWIQVAGPEAILAVEQGPIYSFVPAAPGLHRFALVVAKGGMISAPDFVEVHVGQLAAPPAPAAAPASTPEPAPSPGQFAAATLTGLPGGLVAAGPLAAAFEDSAARVDLYQSYEELYVELARRLEPILPTDPATRAAWERTLFVPLTGHLTEALRRRGLDLRTAEGLKAPWNDDIRRELSGQFREIAAGFRRCVPARPGAGAPEHALTTENNR